MNALILNREWQHPADGWYMIEPLGEHPNAAAKVVQVIDVDALQGISNRFAAEAQKPGFAGMLVDHEHFRHDQDKETRAYGWLMGVQARADGLYGQVRWTNTGRAAVDGGDYRFFSTEYDPQDCQALAFKGNRENAKATRVRPTRLAGLTLTNDPNNKGQKPITNRDEFRRGGDATAANRQQTTEPPEGGTPNNQRNAMKLIAQKLGLAAEASEEAILTEVTKLQNRAETAEKSAGPLNDKVKTLETENKALLDAQVESDLERFKNRFKAEKREGWKKALLANRAQALELLDGLPEAAEAKSTEHGARSGAMLNRANAKTPGSGAESQGDERARADKIRNRAKAIQGASPKMSWDDAWNAACQEIQA